MSNKGSNIKSLFITSFDIKSHNNDFINSISNNSLFKKTSS